MGINTQPPKLGTVTHSVPGNSCGCVYGAIRLYPIPPPPLAPKVSSNSMRIVAGTKQQLHVPACVIMGVITCVITHPLVSICHMLS